MKVSSLAEHIIGSEIIKLAAEVNEKIRKGEHIYNFTIGDFNPVEFPIPAELKQYIREAYQDDQTNYPAADGMADLRKAVSQLLKERGGLHYSIDEILIAGGARPLIYSIYRTIVDPGDAVIFATPSWNNNHYTYLHGARPVVIETLPENHFMPTAVSIAPHVRDASLLALCSPQNPTGTVFSKKDLSEICELVLSENKRRGPDQKPLYMMYDQIYWALTQDGIEHHDPVSLFPEMRDYTIYVDGISKSLSATGVRVGWSAGPRFLIDKMKSILSHVGAWAPKAEQVAVARYLSDLSAYDAFINEQRNKLKIRLHGIFKGIQDLKRDGFRVDAVSPQAAIYLTVQFALHGMKKPDGQVLQTTRDVTAYLLDEARLAIVPFYAFGSSEDSSWYRLSVGTCAVQDIPSVLSSLRTALKKLS
ncbi:MAG TPA: aminotransferase class I/II-fold pyridoxal phosphate-dependent enzyme [Bacteroidia bacterium]|nr:aminotransferase class I/II-fold pyridoxal phosphate-dependent enzyme [Bacteroidia bacterium]